MLLPRGARASEWRKRVNILCCGTSVLVLGALSAGAPAFAQDAPPADKKDKSTEVGEVVVTGIRASLRNAQNIKKNADTFVDSITAEDIGALPDRSVTEALQRVPGVAIDRFAAGVDPDHFSVEGNNVTVRGLSFTRSEFNGRDAFSGTNGQGLNFQDVPAELMAGVDVYKNQTADMIEGGIAGTINLRTRVPFDSAGGVISISAEDSYADFAKKSAPTGSIFVSDRWQTPVGEVGLMLDAVRSELFSRADGDQISNFGQRAVDASGNLVANGTPGSTTVWVPRGAAFRQDDFDHTRTGFGTAAQWRSTDGTMLATFQFLRSDAKESWTEHAVEIATDNVTSNGDSFNVQGTSLSFDGEDVFTSGTITANTGWRSDQFAPTCCRVPIDGLQSNNITRGVQQENIVDDYGFNFKWTPTDRLTFKFDAQHTNAEVDDLDVSVLTSSYQNAAIILHGSSLPTVTFLPPSANGTVVQCTPPGTTTCPTYFNAPHDSFTDPFNYFNRAAMDHIEHSTGYENAFRADGEYKFNDDSFFTAVDFGYRYSDKNETTRFSTYNWGVVTEQWGNNGPIWLDQSVNGSPLASHYSTFTFADFMRGMVAAPTGPQGRIFYSGNPAAQYAQAVSFLESYAQAWQATGGWVALADRPGVVPGTPFLPSEINPEDDKTNAIYGELKYGHRFDNGIDISGNFGLRYFKTDRVSDGGTSFLTATLPSEADCAAIPVGSTPPIFCTYPLTQRNAARAFANGASAAMNAKTSYDFWLPSWNMKVDIGEGRLFRFAVSKAETPPDVGLTRNYVPVALQTIAPFATPGGPLIATATAGNPFLKPQWSWNFDASYEWYFSKVGFVSATVFYKQLHDVIGNGLYDQSFTNNGTTVDTIVTSASNSKDVGIVKGLEVAYQQVYTALPAPFDGFGINANVTYLQSKGVTQNTLSNTNPDVAAGNIANVDTSKLPLQGLSTWTANFSPFYEKGPISLRLAYTWRSRYLLTTRDVIVPFAPIMQEDYGTLDASAFYTLTPHLKLGFQAVNLTNSVLRTSSVLAVTPKLLTAPRSWFMDDRRFTFILRGTW